LDPSFHFAHPWALLLLLAVPLVVLAIQKDRRRSAVLRFPPAAFLKREGRGFFAHLAWLPGVLIASSLAFGTVALARPQMRGEKAKDTSVEGIDIVIAFDMSTSMKAADFKPQNRLHVAKEVLKEFLGKRTNDRVGLVVFAGDAYTQCPLTLDYGILKNLVEALRFGVIEDGTAIGNAIATATNRLKESTAKSKVIILITDGDNNAGQISPIEAAGIAKSMGIKVFSILVGKGGVVPYPAETDPWGRVSYRNVEIPVNPELLKDISRITGGTYYNATDKATLEKGLNDILDHLEKTRLFEAGSFTRYTEIFGSFLAPAFWLAFFGLLLAATRLRPFP
jgi:Ca-activated chloride channel family protein